MRDGKPARGSAREANKPMDCESACAQIGAGTVCNALSVLNISPCRGGEGITEDARCEQACDALRAEGEQGQSFIDSMTRRKSTTVSAVNQVPWQNGTEQPEDPVEQDVAGNKTTLACRAGRYIRTNWQQLYKTYSAHATSSQDPASLASVAISAARTINPGVGMRTRGVQAGPQGTGASRCVSLPADTGVSVTDGVGWYYWNAILTQVGQPNHQIAAVGSVIMQPMQSPVCAATGGTWSTNHTNIILSFNASLYENENGTQRVIPLDGPAIPLAAFPGTIPTGSTPIRYGSGLAGVTSADADMRTFHVRHPSPGTGADINLMFERGEQAVLGNSTCLPGMPMYYSFTNLRVSGTVLLPGKGQVQVEGTGWFDHQSMGAAGASPVARDLAAAMLPTYNVQWDWISASLDDGTAFWFTHVQNGNKKAAVGAVSTKTFYGMRRDADGELCVLSGSGTTAHIDSVFTDDDGNTYPSGWTLTLPFFDEPITFQPFTSTGLMLRHLETPDGTAFTVPDISEVPAIVVYTRTKQRLGVGWVERNGRSDRTPVVNGILRAMGQQGSVSASSVMRLPRRGIVLIVFAAIIVLAVIAGLLALLCALAKRVHAVRKAGVTDT